MAIATYTKTGTKATTAAKLDKAVFGIEVKNHELLHQAYVSYLANGRLNLAVTKKRGEVSGGGRKPWKQKGTGRARFGSSRNPIWRGGGIAFGPTGDENYAKSLNTKAKRLAIRQALSLAAQDDKIIVIDDLTLAKPKTAELAQLLSKVGAPRGTLIVVEHKSETLNRAVSNLPEVAAVQATYLNVFDVLNARKIVVTSGSLKPISHWLGDDKDAPTPKAGEETTS